MRARREDLGEVESEDLDNEPFEDGVGRNQGARRRGARAGLRVERPRHRQRLPSSPADRLAPFYVGTLTGIGPAEVKTPV